MLVNYAWTEGGEISKPFLEALATFVPMKSTDEFVKDLLALIRALEQQGLSRERITDRVMREVNTAAARYSDMSSENPEPLMQYLWTQTGEIDTAFVASLAEFAPVEFRSEFAGDLVELMHELQDKALGRRDIAARVIREVREGMQLAEGGEDT